MNRNDLELCLLLLGVAIPAVALGTWLLERRRLRDFPRPWLLAFLTMWLWLPWLVYGLRSTPMWLFPPVVSQQAAVPAP